MQQEIERAEVWQLEPFNVAVANASEVFLHTISSHLANENRIKLILQRDQPHVRRVSLIPRSRMGQFCKLYFHVSRTSTTGLISSFGISAGQYATITSTWGLCPATPLTAAGPVRINGALSFLNLSTSFRSCPRTPTRSCT